jgi:hypothetical protein
LRSVDISHQSQNVKKCFVSISASVRPTFFLPGWTPQRHFDFYVYSQWTYYGTRFNDNSVWRVVASFYSIGLVRFWVLFITLPLKRLLCLAFAKRPAIVRWNLHNALDLANPFFQTQTVQSAPFVRSVGTIYLEKVPVLDC